MKNQMIRPFLFVFFGTLLFLSTACNRCTKCEYEYTKNGNTQKVDMEEICGNSQDVDDHVQACQDLAKANNGKCLCNDI
jgi:predicted metal-binding protein